MPFTLRSINCMEKSVLQDQQYIFGVRSLFIVEEVLLKNNLAMQPAISHQHRFFHQAFTSLLIAGINALNEYGRYKDTLHAM